METTDVTLEPIDEAVDHVRGGPSGRLIVEYGDYQCPYSRAAFRHIGVAERRLGGALRFCFRHFPLTQIHPRALDAARAAEAAAAQGRFWELHERGVPCTSPEAMPPTLFVDGVVYRGSYKASDLVEVLG